MSGWTLSDGASWELDLDEILDVDEFVVFDDFGIILNNDGELIKLKDSFLCRCKVSCGRCPIAVSRPFPIDGQF